MLTILDVYLAVIAANATCLMTAWIWHRGRSETEDSRETWSKRIAVFFLVGMPIIYVISSQLGI